MLGKQRIEMNLSAIVLLGIFLLGMLYIQILFAKPAFSQGVLESGTSAQERIELFMSEASLIRLDEPAQLIAVGDTNIADATLVSSRTILLTAKSVGRTNFLAVNSDDEIVKELIIVVREPGVSTIQVRRGNEVIEYICRQSQGCVERSQAAEQITPPE